VVAPLSRDQQEASRKAEALEPILFENALRADEPRPSLSVEEALANAPDRENDAFRVPAA